VEVKTRMSIQRAGDCAESPQYTARVNP